MKNGQIKKYWKFIKNDFKENFDYLSDEDLAYRDGFEEELIDTLKNKTGYSKEEIIYLIFTYISKYKKE